MLIRPAIILRKRKRPTFVWNPWAIIGFLKNKKNLRLSRYSFETDTAHNLLSRPYWFIISKVIDFYEVQKFYAFHWTLFHFLYIYLIVQKICFVFGLSIPFYEKRNLFSVTSIPFLKNTELIIPFLKNRKTELISCYVNSVLKKYGIDYSVFEKYGIDNFV